MITHNDQLKITGVAGFDKKTDQLKITGMACDTTDCDR
jgi:hypothetical protein